MNWKQLLRDYFTFSRRERIGLLIIVILIVGIWFSPKFISPRRAQNSDMDTSWMATVEKLEQRRAGAEKDASQQDENPDETEKPLASQKTARPELFYFDPNTLSPDGWKRLGLREKTIGIIQKYLRKGGHFYKPEDLKKIYGIYAGEYAFLEPYIRIGAKPDKANQFAKTEYRKDEPLNRPLVVDINIADTAAFIALPGIGSKLASRIVNFRERLGGFYSIDQISETYGLPDSIFKKIRSFLQLKTVSVKKININSATKDELKIHPYIKWNLANAIVEYRSQHGNFSSLDDLKKISLITDDVFGKLKFYLTIDSN